MAGKFERKPWLDGTRDDDNATGANIILTPTNDFYLVSATCRNNTGGGSVTTLRDGGVAGAIIVNGIATAANQTVLPLYFGDAPCYFATDIAIEIANWIVDISGYDY